MTDISVLTGLTSVHRQRAAHSRVLWVSISAGYLLTWDQAGGTFICLKTTNGGTSWSELDAGNAPAAGPRSMDFYWEIQNGNPNDADLGHVACLDATDHELQHTTFDIGTETWSGVLVDTTATITSVSGSSGQSSIAMAVNTAGDILIPWRADQDGEVGCMFWDESASDWTEVSASNSPWLGPFQTDDIQCEVINGGADFLTMEYDESADILWLQVYRAAAEDWTPLNSSITGILSNPDHNSYVAAAYDWTNDQVGIAVFTDVGVSTGDLRFYTVSHDGTDVAASPTAETDVISNDANKSNVDVCYDPVNDEFCVIYGDGVPAGAAVNPRWKTTPVGTISWSAETADYMGTDRDYRLIRGFAFTDATGGRIHPVVEDNDGFILYVNDANDVEIAATGSVPVVRGLETGTDFGATAARLDGLLVT